MSRRIKNIFIGIGMGAFVFGLFAYSWYFDKDFRIHGMNVSLMPFSCSSESNYSQPFMPEPFTPEPFVPEPFVPQPFR